METRERARKIRLRFYNVVIHPANRQSQQAYIDLFQKCFDLNRTYETGSGKKTKMREFSNGNNLIMGGLINYTTLDNDNWYNEISDEVEKHETEPNIHPNAKRWNFYFYPEKHRMAVEIRQGISWTQIEKYFKKAFADACESLGFDEVAITQETDQEGIDEIFALDSIESLEIEISYSNNDINDLIADAIDSELKSSNVSMLKTKAIGTKECPIVLNENQYLGSLIKLSRHNGSAKATGKSGNETIKVNTKDYPKISTLKEVSSNNLFSKIVEAILSILQ